MKTYEIQKTLESYSHQHWRTGKTWINTRPSWLVLENGRSIGLRFKTKKEAQAQANYLQIIAAHSR